MLNVGASVHYESSQNIIGIGNLAKPCKSWKAIFMLFNAVNGNQIMKYQVNSANTIPSPKGSCMAESTPNPSKSLMCSMSITPLVSCFSFAKVMAFWKTYFQMKCISEHVITTSMASWKQLSTFSRSVLFILQNDSCWKNSSKLDPKTIFDTKKGLGAVAKFLKSLLQFLCC